MNSIFKFKLLSYLIVPKKDKGTTLMELLVVVIIIALLAAIALPNLLPQLAKGRNAEGKSGVGALNRAQQLYRTENRSFGNRSDLDTKVANGKYFTFASDNGSSSASATSIATPVDSAGDQTTTQTGTVAYDGANFTVTTSW
jgi:prepilin-type N-terminal cleavage/methylation domain-containing protein